MFSLIFRIAREQHRERSIIQTRHDRVRVRLVAAGPHLLFGKERLVRSEDVNNAPPRDRISFPVARLRTSAPLEQLRFVIVVKLCDRQAASSVAPVLVSPQVFSFRGRLLRHKLGRNTRFLPVVDHVKHLEGFENFGSAAMWSGCGV